MSSYFGGEEEEDIPDILGYEEPDNLIETDEATFQSTYLVAHEPDDDNILRTRTYDVSITMASQPGLNNARPPHRLDPRTTFVGQKTSCCSS
ncbi:hypothetical protein IFM89_032108 [Coptis chinensis]|uniref:Uncharacterized protein n=1 Tax=Coptis chinensis TaxID=261450 RepID=A0A835M278_9MAGN|nr:hypothetical protein IFM89_032108 [Coptis chinensis]